MKCNTEDCPCQEEPDVLEGTVEEMINEVNRRAHERADVLAEHIINHDEAIRMLTFTLERMLSPDRIIVTPTGNVDPTMN